MPYCYYTCNLVPLELIARRGYSPRWLGNRLRDTSALVRRDALSVHPMTCPYVTKLVAAADDLFGSSANAAADDENGGGSDCLVVPAGCDAMRRMGDLMAAAYPGRVFVLPMPRSSGPAVEARLAADLRCLDEWLVARLPDPGQTETADAGPAPGGEAALGAGSAPDAAPECGAARKSGADATADRRPKVDYPTPPRPRGVFVVAGPLSDDSLLRLIVQLGSHVAALESCTSPDRWAPLAALPATDPNGVAEGPPDYDALARLVLETGMCPRRSTTDRRAHLVGRLDESQPSSIIYARQSFCDPGAYDALLVSQLARERDLPYLEIEVDFPFDANGPLRTRVEAFLEAQLLDDDLLSGGLAEGRGHGETESRGGGETRAADQCGDCPGAHAQAPRAAVLDDDLPDDLFDEEA